MLSTLVIAEAGVNHNGNMSHAKKLIDIAVKAGADVVKFQSFKADDLVTHVAPKAAYQALNTGKNDGQYNMLKQLELTTKDLKELIRYAESKNIACISTPFSESSAEEIAAFMPFWKIPSGEITNYPFLKNLALYHKPIILSTGMSTLLEVEMAVKIITECWDNHRPTSIMINKKELKPLSLLHCVSNYPASFESLNLRVISTLRQHFKLPVGYSDHTTGIEASIAAVALNAEIIEKHFTLDKNLEGPDHKASLDSEELKQMIDSIRNIEKSLGTGIKKPHENEQDTMLAARKSIHLNKSLSEGSILQSIDIVMKRPGNGLSADNIPRIVGKKIKTSLEKDHMLTLSDLE